MVLVDIDGLKTKTVASVDAGYGQDFCRYIAHFLSKDFLWKIFFLFQFIQFLKFSFSKNVITLSLRSNIAEMSLSFLSFTVLHSSWQSLFKAIFSLTFVSKKYVIRVRISVNFGEIWTFLSDENEKGTNLNF